MSIILTLPIFSANRYLMPVSRGKHLSIMNTKEATAYKAEVRKAAMLGGFKKLVGRVKVELWMYPQRPKDWQTRMRKLGENWDDSVRAIDVDNISKLLLDGLKDAAFGDDKFVFQLSTQRMEPDDKGARVVVRISKIDLRQPQAELIGE